MHSRTAWRFQTWLLSLASTTTKRPSCDCWLIMWHKCSDLNASILLPEPAHGPAKRTQSKSGDCRQNSFNIRWAWARLCKSWWKCTVRNWRSCSVADEDHVYGTWSMPTYQPDEHWASSMTQSFVHQFENCCGEHSWQCDQLPHQHCPWARQLRKTSSPHQAVRAKTCELDNPLQNQAFLHDQSSCHSPWILAILATHSVLNLKSKDTWPMR